MDKNLLKQILRDNQAEIERYVVEPRSGITDDFPCWVMVGVRRAGKSFMLYDIIHRMLAGGHRWDEMLYLNFEDERLEDFSAADFNKLLECHQEVYGRRPVLFLDEIQNVLYWEKFARRMADCKYRVFITGSNARMLSKDINTTLGGRFMTREVYPYSLAEYLRVLHVPSDGLSQSGTESRAGIIRAFHEYLLGGGLPEAAMMAAKRNYVSSVYQKIYLGDVIARNNIANTAGIKVMIKKIAESVCRPVSYNRINNLMSSVGGRLSLASTIRYIEYCEDAWLLLRLRNYTAHLAEKESNCKFYFVDNGVLGLFLIGKESMLLENLVAVELFRRYGHDSGDERVFFYLCGDYEVDFYIPETETAIQVAYSLADEETRKREVTALSRIARHLPCARRIILTYDETGILADGHGDIDVIPVWKWCLCV